MRRLPIVTALLARCAQPGLDQQDVPIDHAPGYRSNQLLVRYPVEIFRQIGVQHVGVAAAEQRVQRLARSGPALSRPMTMSRGARDPLRRSAPAPARPRPAPPGPGSSGYRAAARHRRAFGSSPVAPMLDAGLVSATLARGRPTTPRAPPPRSPRRLARPGGLAVHAGCAPVRTGQRVGMVDDVLPVDLAIEHLEAERRLRLRLAVEPPLQHLEWFACLPILHQSPPYRLLRKRTRSRAPSLHRHYPASTVL